MAKGQFAANAQDSKPPNTLIVGRDECANNALAARLGDTIDQSVFSAERIFTASSFITAYTDALKTVPDFVIFSLDESDLSQQWAANRIEECLTFISGLETQMYDVCFLLSCPKECDTPALEPLMQKVYARFTPDRSSDFVQGLIAGIRSVKRAKAKVINERKDIRAVDQKFYQIGNWIISTEDTWALPTNNRDPEVFLSTEEHSIIKNALCYTFKDMAKIQPPTIGKPRVKYNQAYRLRGKLGDSFPIQAQGNGQYTVEATPLAVSPYQNSSFINGRELFQIGKWTFIRNSQLVFSDTNRVHLTIQEHDLINKLLELKFSPQAETSNIFNIESQTPTLHRIKNKLGKDVPITKVRNEGYKITATRLQPHI